MNKRVKKQMGQIIATHFNIKKDIDYQIKKNSEKSNNLILRKIAKVNSWF